MLEMVCLIGPDLMQSSSNRVIGLSQLDAAGSEQRKWKSCIKRQKPRSLRCDCE